MRELKLTGEEDVAANFADIEALAPQCRFGDCGTAANRVVRSAWRSTRRTLDRRAATRNYLKLPRRGAGAASRSPRGWRPADGARACPGQAAGSSWGAPRVHESQLSRHAGETWRDGPRARRPTTLPRRARRAHGGGACAASSCSTCELAGRGPAHLPHGWHAGKHRCPAFEYATHDFSAARRELADIAAGRSAASARPLVCDSAHPGASRPSCSRRSVRPASPSLRSACSDVPMRRSPGSGQTNLDAARHFIALPTNSTRTARRRGTGIDPAERCSWTAADLDDFFDARTINVEIDPHLIAKAAAGATRIRLRRRRVSPNTTAPVARARGVRAFAHRVERARAAAAGFAGADFAARHRDPGRPGDVRRTHVRLDRHRRMKRISLRIVAIDKALRRRGFHRGVQVLSSAPGRPNRTVSPRRCACSAARR